MRTECIVTGEETWIYEFNRPATQQAYKLRIKNTEKKPGQNRQKSGMTVVFFNICEACVRKLVKIV